VAGGIGTYYWAVTNPERAIGILEILDGYYGGSSPGNNIGSFINGLEIFLDFDLIP